MTMVWDKGTYDPVLGIDLAIPLHPASPSATHLLGTDPLGRDILSQLMWSARSELALVVGIVSGFGAAAIIIKSQAMTIKVRTYIEAARVAGGSNAHIIMRHIVPNLLQ